ncbi:hypothetical protein H311_03311 [Anncaliia algerae PRA109]|nr:hypothetical protein H311_03311 [Anncaliia algerae PRA109]
MIHLIQKMYMELINFNISTVKLYDSKIEILIKIFMYILIQIKRFVSVYARIRMIKDFLKSISFKISVFRI